MHGDSDCIPFLSGDSGLAEDFFQKSRTNVFGVGVRNSDLLGTFPFGHELMSASRKGSRVSKASELTDEFSSGDGNNHLCCSFLFEFNGCTVDLRNGISVPYLEN